MQRKLDVPRSNLSLSIPTYSGAFIKPVSNANWYSLMSLRSVNLNLSLIMIPSIPVLSLILPSKRSVFRSRLPIFIPHLALKISRIPHSASILSPIPHPAKPMLDSHCFECLFASLVPLLCLLEVAFTCNYILF